MKKAIFTAVALCIGFVATLFLGGLIGGWMEDFFFETPNDDAGPENGMVVGSMIYVFGIIGVLIWWTNVRDS